MNKVNYSDYTLSLLKKIKEDRTVYVVFSTFGEREAELIKQKIELLTTEISPIIDRFIVSHRREGAEPELTEERAREANSETSVLICNDFPVPDMKDEKGKGADMRRTLFHINTIEKGKDLDKIVIVFLDADVVPEHFGSHFVLALAGAICQGNTFAKASFWRAMGRVKKYVAQPLFSAIDHPKLNTLRTFHYPLSGEVAGTLAFFNSVSFWQMYGVETGINIESVMKEEEIADVNLGLYDHEHHGEVGIQKMSFGIIRTYLKQLIDFGIIELKDNATLSDTFAASFIDDHENRRMMEFDLKELKYQPLNTILK